MRLFIWLIATLAPLLLWSQKNWEFGLHAGIMSYEGDLTETARSAVKYSHAAYGVSVSKYVLPSWALRLEGTYGNISGNDVRFDEPSWHQRRRFSFTSPVIESSLRLEWDIFGSRRFKKEEWTEGEQKGTYYRFQRTLSPYLFGGVGITYYNPTTDYNQPNYPKFASEISRDKAATRAQTGLSLPFGAGLRYDLTKRMVLGVESTVYQPFTDYLDGISEAGNPGRNDWYGSGLVTMRYRVVHDDRDQDGVADDEDSCPNIVGIKENKGCPADGDGDGVADKDDQCPVVVGLKQFKGCPDGDDDGIEDRLDLCPRAKGLKEFNGCPDADEDKITDSEDECPYLAGETRYNGCPDSDKDGIEDRLDECPLVNGDKNFKGCPDSDLDGIEDRLDECPLVKGTTMYKGCPDSDLDTVEDKQDPCAHAKGDPNFKGCPDSDLDGIEDRKDECPYAKGDARFGGCPDSDGDGVEDRKDNCPMVAGPVNMSGCPAKGKQKSAKNTTKETPAPAPAVATLAEGEYMILFESGSSKLSTEAKRTLDKIAATLKADPSLEVLLQGHTDKVGSDEMNYKLSEARVDACNYYLIKRGVTPTFQYYGEYNPLSNNDARNRRVEASLRKRNK